MNNIYLIVGPSGSGKTTLAEELEKKGLKQVQSYTTRPERHAGEKGHIFILPEVMANLKEKAVAYTRYDGYEYCATQDQIEECDIYVIDPAGVETMLLTYMGDKGIRVIILECPNDICVSRMRERGTNQDEAWRRSCKDRTTFYSFSYNDSYRRIAFKNYDEAILSSAGPIDDMTAAAWKLVKAWEQGE